MIVSVIDSRNDAAAAKIDLLGMRIGEGRDDRGVAGGNNAFAANGETVVRLGEVIAAAGEPTAAFRGRLDLSW